MKKVLVVGGGAAGMMAAYFAAKEEAQVTIVEKNKLLGRKIRITGKGRCNVTNASDLETIIKNIYRNGNFMYSSLYSFTNALVTITSCTPSCRGFWNTCLPIIFVSLMVVPI